jgi:hypothetical protein
MKSRPPVTSPLRRLTLPTSPSCVGPGRAIIDGFEGDLIPAGHVSGQGAQLTVPRRRASRAVAGQRVASGDAHSLYS